MRFDRRVPGSRSVPNKKSMAATMALFGTTIASVTRYFLGHWLPSLRDVLYNRVGETA